MTDTIQSLAAAYHSAADAANAPDISDAEAQPFINQTTGIVACIARLPGRSGADLAKKVIVWAREHDLSLPDDLWLSIVRDAGRMEG